MLTLHAAAMAQSMHDSAADPRNASILISVNGELKPRDEAMVSVFDSGFVLGDGVWEGLRVHKGRIAFLDRHLDRLCEGAKAIAMDIGLEPRGAVRRLYETLDANGMDEGVHIRLMVTRGIRSTPYQDPRVVISPATIVIIPEYKEPLPAIVEQGITLFTVHVRRGDPAVQDPKLNSHSKLNCITACIQAAQAGADEALMLDPHGFVATCNSTHFFIVRKGEVWTSTGDYCLGGITRGNVIEICREQGIPVFEKNFSLTDVYGADEAFVTGTFAGVVPVREIDGRQMTDGRGPMVERLQGLYRRGSRPTWRGRRVPDGPVRIAMWSGPAQPLDRDDAQLRQPRRHLRQRRAFLRRLPEDERRRPPDARGGDRGDGLRLGERRPDPGRAVPRTARRSGTRSICGTIWSGRSAIDDFAGFTHAFLIRDPGAMIASYLRKRESAGVRGFRPRPPGRVLRARGRPARAGAAGRRRERRAAPIRKAC